MTAAWGDANLLRRTLETLDGYQQLGNEVFSGDGATFCRNRAYPRKHDANYVSRIEAETPEEIERLLARVEAEYAGFGHRRLDVDPLTPPAFAARLVIDGWRRDDGIQLLLEGELLLTARAADTEIRLVETEEAWGERDRLSALDWAENCQRTGRPHDTSVLVDFTASTRAKAPDARHWLAYAGGQAVGYFSSWPGKNGIGQVEDLFTESAYRHRGIATALIAHCVADARARGAREVVITADPTDTPMVLYAAMGFRPLMTGQSYMRRLEATTG